MTYIHTLQTLRDLYAGQPAAILGGGPSLPDDLARLHVPLNGDAIQGDAAKPQGGPVLIAVNHHALAYCRPHIVVHMDKLGEESPELTAALKDYTGIRISQITAQSDLNLREIPYWDGGFSSSLATWLACAIGCNPVLLCGMDCYQGEKKYCTDYVNTHPCVNYPLENHLAAWRPALAHCPHPERIKAVSGPLTELFGKYELVIEKNKS